MASGPHGLNPLDDPAGLRSAGRDLLSLALLDARNHLLKLLAAFDVPDADVALQAPAWQTALRGAVWQARWLLAQGTQIQSEADRYSHPHLIDHAALRAWMAEVLDASLDRLAELPDEPAALLHFHQAVLHEDRLGEHLAVLLQHGSPPARSQRPAIWLAAQRWQMGSEAAAGVPFNEWGNEPVALLEFEIDAQPVNWQQYAEFAADGGYDRPELWGDVGWSWLQAQTLAQPEGRRAPRHVAQLLGGVLVQRGASAGLQRAAAGQAAMHVSRFEAQAWCRWAGRRLPTEPEWELAACAATSRGFVWGDVYEWVAGSARAYTAAAAPLAGCLDTPPPAGSQGVLRGASFATRQRRHHPKARRFMAPGHDLAFCGFRSCAL